MEAKVTKGRMTGRTELVLPLLAMFWAIAASAAPVPQSDIPGKVQSFELIGGPGISARLVLDQGVDDGWTVKSQGDREVELTGKNGIGFALIRIEKSPLTPAQNALIWEGFYQKQGCAAVIGGIGSVKRGVTDSDLLVSAWAECEDSATDETAVFRTGSGKNWGGRWVISALISVPKGKRSALSDRVVKMMVKASLSE